MEGLVMSHEEQDWSKIVNIDGRKHLEKQQMKGS